MFLFKFVRKKSNISENQSKLLAISVAKRGIANSVEFADPTQMHFWNF